MGEGDGKSGSMDRLRAAAAFLTRLPFRTASQAPLAEAAGAFPLVGAAIGAIGAGAYWGAFSLGLGPWLAAVAAVLALVLVTGALHEDGLADSADGFGAMGRRLLKLKAMRDSPVGAHGALALGLALAARIGALATLGEPLAAGAALVAASAFSRTAIVVALRIAPPARDDGQGATAGVPSNAQTAIAVALGLAFTVALLWPWAGALALAIGSCAAGLMIWQSWRHFGGHTGDVLGAIQQASEIGVLIAPVMLL